MKQNKETKIRSLGLNAIGIKRIERLEILVKRMSKMIFTSTMIFVLVVGYLLIVTNPPSDLLQYDENEQRVVTKDLSNLELPQYVKSTLVFISIFGLAAIFIGEMAACIFIKPIKKRKKETYYFEIDLMLIPVFLSIIVLSLIPLPYYGWALTSMMLFVGIIAFLVGTMIGLPYMGRLWGNFSLWWVPTISVFTFWYIAGAFKIKPLYEILSVIYLILIASFILVWRKVK